LSRLLVLGAVPVINENDTVATDEIRFGDNDRLAARVAAMIGCDVLVLLSDIDGLYSRDPGLHRDAEFIAEVSEITAEIEAMAGATRSGLGRGGMTTKLQAARIALNAGCHMAIADGRRLHPLASLAEGGRATWFVSQASPTLARKRWIAGGLRPAGVVAVEGQFERGDAVLVRDVGGGDLARGLIAYSAEDARRIMRRRTAEIEAILGYRGRAEMIHRDDLALL
jgi:glutamate 5-kinase